MTEPNWDRVTELFRKEFPEYEHASILVFEVLKEFRAFRLGYQHGGVDALTEVSARMKGKNVVRGG